MHIPQPIRRLAPVTAIVAGVVTLGASAAGVASMDGALVSAAAQQHQVRFVVDAPAPAPETACPRRSPAAEPGHWRS